MQKKDKEKIMIKEVISNDNDISETFNNSKIENNLQWKPGNYCETENPIQNAINKFRNYHSIKMMISKINPNERFFVLPSSTQ